VTSSIFSWSAKSPKILIAPIKPADLWKKIKAVRQQIITGETEGPLNSSLSALYENLITPIEAELAQVKVIAFIPNELLFYLPMQALVKKGTNGEMHYLIEDKQIVYLTTADVDDESTKEFMIHFYTQLAAGKSKAASLQRAQIMLMTPPKFSHPLFWAPFVLMGDWR
jgi:CHAT domain-containing protein